MSSSTAGIARSIVATHGPCRRQRLGQSVRAQSAIQCAGVQPAIRLAHSAKLFASDLMSMYTWHYSCVRAHLHGIHTCIVLIFVRLRLRYHACDVSGHLWSWAAHQLVAMHTVCAAADNRVHRRLWRPRQRHRAAVSNPEVTQSILLHVCCQLFVESFAMSCSWVAA